MAEPYLRTTWSDPETGRGYLVVDRLVDGIAGGGTRVREGCSLEEVERLAHALANSDRHVAQLGTFSSRATPAGG